MIPLRVMYHILGTDGKIGMIGARLRTFDVLKWIRSKLPWPNLNGMVRTTNRVLMILSMVPLCNRSSNVWLQDTIKYALRCRLMQETTVIFRQFRPSRFLNRLVRGRIDRTERDQRVSVVFVFLVRVDHGEIVASRNTSREKISIDEIFFRM